jgi:uncharacterized repeat protein (TIGR03943 family)
VITCYVRAGLLVGFGLLIGKLFATGEMVRYMSPALDPITALAGFLLVAMGIGELGRCQHPDPDREPGATHLLERSAAILLIAAPIALGLVLEPRALGTSALDGEDLSRLVVTYGSARGADGHGESSREPLDDVPHVLAFVAERGERAIGQPVRVVGLAARGAGLASDELALIRYSMVHCVADAQAIALLVVAPDIGSLPNDGWVQIEGQLDSRERGGDRLVTVVAQSIIAVERPPNPYLTGVSVSHGQRNAVLAERDRRLA